MTAPKDDGPVATGNGPGAATAAAAQSQFSPRRDVIILALVCALAWGVLAWQFRPEGGAAMVLASALASVGTIGGVLLARRTSRASSALYGEPNDQTLAELVIDHAETPIVVTDGTNKVLRFNPAGAALSGYTMAELSDPAVWSSLLPPEERARVRAAVDAKSDTPFPRVIENHWITRSGERRLLRWTNSALRRADGSIHAVVSVGADITDAKQAETIARRTESALRRAHRIAQLGHWNWTPAPGTTTAADDRAGAYSYSSEAADIFGISAETLNRDEENAYAALIHPDDRQEAMEGYRAFLAASKTHLTQDYRLRHADGSIRHVRVMSEKLFDAAGNITEVAGIVQDLTEIRRAELAIRQVQMILTAAQKLAGVGYWFWEGADGSDVSSDKPIDGFHYSAEAQAVSGLSQQLMQTLPTDEFCRRFVHENDRDRAMDLFTRFSEGRIDQYTIEYGYLHPVLGERVLRSVALRERDAAGHSLHATGMIQDITDLRRDESALRHQEDQLAAAHHLARLGYWSWLGGIDRTPIRQSTWSNEAVAITGIDRETAEAAMLADDFELRFTHPDDLLRVLRAIGELRDQRIARYDLDYRLRRPDGGEIWVRSLAELRKDSEGRVIGAYGILQDISDRKRAEAELRLAHQSLANAQRIAHVGNWSRDLATGKITWSDEVYRILGHEPRSFPPSLDLLLQAVHPDDHRALNAAIDKCLTERAPYLTDHRVLLADGTVRHVREQGEVVLDSDGKPRRLEGVLLDITEIKAREKALNEARLRAETADRAKTEFLGNMSHELRTPLNAVIGFADVLSQQLFGPIPDNYRESIDAISQSGRHLLEIINDLLEMSRIESGERHLAEHPFDPFPAIVDCCRLAQAQAQREGIQLTIDETGQLPVLAGEERAFKQVLNNLLSNALKFTPRGGSVAVTATGNLKDGLLVAVSDTGRGIDPTVLPQLGKPFAQGEATLSRRYGGIGLGLAISRRLMDLHGGRLEITSTPGQGSRVIMSFPKERVYFP
ncbi:MAG: PAS domain-containing protein [Rhodospirillaceae bacterium]|nr:PAS domain-containing protein [Rhodospirillaceae bacterium]